MESLSWYADVVDDIIVQTTQALGLPAFDRKMWNIECVTSVSLWQSQKQNIDLTRQAKFASTPAFALFVTLKNVVCKIGEDAEVLMSLYDPVESKFIR